MTKQISVNDIDQMYAFMKRFKELHAFYGQLVGRTRNCAIALARGGGADEGFDGGPYIVIPKNVVMGILDAEMSQIRLKLRDTYNVDVQNMTWADG